MSEPKFTKGPWLAGHMADSDSTCNCRSIVCEWYMGAVASIPKRVDDKIEDGGNDCPPEEEAIGNAHLIAAAPEMFEALEAMIGGYAFLARDLRWPFDEINKAGCVMAARAALAKARGDAP